MEFTYLELFLDPFEAMVFNRYCRSVGRNLTDEEIQNIAKSFIFEKIQEHFDPDDFWKLAKEAYTLGRSYEHEQNCNLPFN